MATFKIHTRHGDLAPSNVEAVTPMAACSIVASLLYGTPSIGSGGWGEWSFIEFRDMFLVDGVIYDIDCWAFEKGPDKGRIYFRGWPWVQKEINGDTGLDLVADLLKKLEATP